MFKGAATKGSAVAAKSLKGKTTSSSSSSIASTNIAALDEKKVDALFTSLADEDDCDFMSMDGIEKLCEKLKIDPSTDVRLLVLLWKMKAIAKPGSVSRKEFTEGMMTVLKKDTLEAVKGDLSSLDPGFIEGGSNSPFADFYKFVFNFSREGMMSFCIL